MVSSTTTTRRKKTEEMEDTKELKVSAYEDYERIGKERNQRRKEIWNDYLMG
jgi:hypothetical protein